MSSAAVAAGSSPFQAFSVLYIVPTSSFAFCAWLLFIMKNHSTFLPSLSIPAVFRLVFQSTFVSFRLTCVALYFNINIMHYVPFIAATCPVSTMPPPPARAAFLSIIPVSALLAPIFLFLANYIGLFLLGVYNIDPPPNLVAVQARSQLSTLLTHPLHLLVSVNRPGMHSFFSLPTPQSPALLCAVLEINISQSTSRRGTGLSLMLRLCSMSASIRTIILRCFVNVAHVFCFVNVTHSVSE
jgi:hypothetical protein